MKFLVRFLEVETNGWEERRPQVNNCVGNPVSLSTKANIWHWDANAPTNGSSNYHVYYHWPTENLELPETFRSAQSLLLMWFTQLLVCQSGSAVHLPNSFSVWTKFCPFTAASVNWTVCQIRGPTTVASSLSLGLGLICYQCRDSCIPIGFPSFGFPKLFKLLALFEPWVAI